MEFWLKLLVTHQMPEVCVGKRRTFKQKGKKSYLTIDKNETYGKKVAHEATTMIHDFGGLTGCCYKKMPQSYHRNIFSKTSVEKVQV